jgi:hypothetical protein
MYTVPSSYPVDLIFGSGLATDYWDSILPSSYVRKWFTGTLLVEIYARCYEGNNTDINLILFIPYILTLYSQSEVMYNSITLILQFHCPTCFELSILVHLQGLITHYSHQLVQLFTWIPYIRACTLSKTVLSELVVCWVLVLNTINVIELYISSDCEYNTDMFFPWAAVLGLWKPNDSPSDVHTAGVNFCTNCCRQCKWIWT